MPLLFVLALTNTNEDDRTRNKYHFRAEARRGLFSNNTMGNQHSASPSPIDLERLRPFSRSGGALGLSRSELDKRCQPSG